MDLEKKRIYGKIDGKEAVIQAIWKNLSTCRFAYLIYDDFYGSDIFYKINDNDLTPEYLDSDLPVMVEEALLIDNRVLGVANFKYDIVDCDSVHVSFTALTIYGEVNIEGVIANGGCRNLADLKLEEITEEFLLTECLEMEKIRS